MDLISLNGMAGTAVSLFQSLRENSINHLTSVIIERSFKDNCKMSNVIISKDGSVRDDGRYYTKLLERSVWMVHVNTWDELSGACVVLFDFLCTCLSFVM